MLPFKPNKQYTSIALYATGAIAVAIVVGAVLFHISDVTEWFSHLLSALSPLIYGLIFAYLLRPIARRFELLFFKIYRKEHRVTEKGVQRADIFGRMSAILLTYLVIFAVLFVFVRFLLPLLIGDGKLLGSRILGLMGNFASIVSDLGAVFGLNATELDLLNIFNSYRDTIATGIASVGTSFALAAFDMLIGLCLSVGILYHRVHMTACARRLIVAFFPARICRYIHRVADYSDHTFGKYLVGKIVECTIVGLLYLIVLPIMRIPYPFLITIIMTVTNFIPVIGAYVGGIPSAILILTATDPIMVIWFALLCLAVEQIDGNIIAPRVLGSVLGLRPVWIMLSVALFGGFFGIFGMFLAAPIFSILYMLVRDATHHRLQKKGQPINSEHYETLFASTASRKRHFFKHRFSHKDTEADQK